jgi:flagellar biosynthesis protein FlhA
MKQIFARHTDLVMVLLVVGILTVLFVPIPSSLLDLLILSNVSFALLVLLLTFYSHRPVDFSTFPSLLLIATLFRLSLNVAATRLILSEADAGRVISAIGGYVVGGNYVIGLIVFLILVVVQYVVVTNGAQRVSEVAARFSLDSMPGQQMSIDADLNMGFIDQDEAKRRRKLLEKESNFYGAMDGASKFVKGDAIAGILILLINIIGGLVVGVMQMGMPWDQALHTFTLLTVGDGIVTQVPALVIAVGTGIIVTRSGADSDLSGEVLRQMTSFPKAIWVVTCALGVLAFVPGIPGWPVLLLGGALAALALALRPPTAAPAAAGSAEAEPAREDPYAALAVDPVAVLAGSVVAQVVGGEDGAFSDRMAALRKQFTNELGVVLPRVRCREQPALAATAYEIQVFGVTVARGELHAERILAIRAVPDAPVLPGIETKEPTYGLPAYWVEERHRELARTSRYTLVDPLTVFITHLSEVLRAQAAVLLTRSEADKLLQRIRDSHPGLVEDLVPTVLSVSDVQRVLQYLLREKVSVRHLEAIVETLVDAGRSTKDPALLTEQVRQRLGAFICQPLLTAEGVLQVLTLDPAAEQFLLFQLRKAEAGGQFMVEPRFAERLLSSTAALADRAMRTVGHAVLLCSPELRRHLRALMERSLPHVRVVSMAEIPGSLSLRAVGAVKVELPQTNAKPAANAAA